MRNYSIIFACDSNNGIGKNNNLPWKIPVEMQYFTRITTHNKNPIKKNVVIMGKNTSLSIGKSLPNRFNFIVSSTLKGPNVYPDLETLMLYLDSIKVLDGFEIGKIFIIGGRQLYQEAMVNERCTAIYRSLIAKTYDCDLFLFGGIEKNFAEFINNTSFFLSDEKNIFIESERTSCSFQKYKKISGVENKNKEEQTYLDLMHEILAKGGERQDRTETGTISLFCKQLTFSLANDTLPLLTTKRVFWKGIKEELLWFIAGHTDANLLKEKGVKIWDGNSSREFLDSRGLVNNRVGDLGEVYGFQWRHWGAQYVNCDKKDYGGIDQLKNVIENIKKDPFSRRHIVSAWNVGALHNMALPPCHIMYQFLVDKDRKLYCNMYQRSADMALGIPFNIASYALLTHMVARCTGTIAERLTINIGDCHIYSNHIDGVVEQLKRMPYSFPKIKFLRECTDIDGFLTDDFEVVDYKAHPSIAFKMAV